MHYVSLWARRFLIETGQTEEDLAHVAVAQREWAEHNERAYLRAPHSVEAHLAAPYVAEPFRVPDCTIEVDGACALVITSVDAARDLAQPPVVIEGAACRRRGAGLDMGDSLFWEDLSQLHRLPRRTWGGAGLAPGDVRRDLRLLHEHGAMGLEGLACRRWRRRRSQCSHARGRSAPVTHGGLRRRATSTA